MTRSRNVTDKCNLKPNENQHVDGDGSYWARDARGIELRRVCFYCRPLLKRDYRAAVLNDPSYETDEPIESD